MPSDLEIVLRKITEALTSLQIRFVVGGSISSSIFGIPRSTNDVDILLELDRERAAALVGLLKGQFYIDADRVQGSVSTQRSFSIIHLATLLKVDFFIRVSDPWLEEEMRRKRQERISNEADSITIPVSSPEDNILHKLRWFLMGGLVSEKQWKDILGVLKVQQKNLDYDYLRRWAIVMGLAELLDKALHEALPKK